MVLSYLGSRDDLRYTAIVFLSDPMGSTDMGNVSHVIPAIHPYVAIAPCGVAGHSVEMREAACSPQGDEGLMLSAKALAMTVVDLLVRPELVRHAQEEFQRTFRTGKER
jgi:metal-dependent amidase/aminoacylase/carboxypeptidase family protein